MHGFLLLDKPAGVSSAAALAPVKRSLPRGVRVGHAGTLDPFATGLLIVLLGDATRLASLATGLPKEYEATVRFGEETDTLDPTGVVVSRADPGGAPPPALAGAVASFAGERLQEPPAYSALKVGGRRAYRLARAGEAPALAPRPVHIRRIAIAAVRWPDVDVALQCSAGTYVRAVARDLGRAIGLPARLESLRRSAIGPFRAEAAVRPAPDSSVDAPAALLPPLALVRAAGLSEVALDAAEARRFVRGGAAPVPGGGAGDAAAVLAGRGLLLGLGTFAGPSLRPRIVLPSAAAEVTA